MRTNSENENTQKIVTVEICSEKSECGNIKPNERALPISNKFSIHMTETLVALMNSRNSMKLIQEGSGRASILKTPIYTKAGDRLRIKDNNHDLTPEIYKTIFNIIHW